MKLCILAGLGYTLLHHLIDSELGGATLPLPTTLGIAGASTSGLLRDVGVVALLVAGADYVFQRRSYQQGLRMTKQEVKDENRRNDGSPEVRRALRSKARQLSRMRMMAAVASADVVVTNPTHFAVAIAYDRKKDRAPRVVAKGADLVAARIRRRAAEHGVPVVENPVLARTLHASCEVHDVVPTALYTAVARLLAFVYSLSPTAKMLGEVHRMAPLRVGRHGLKRRRRARSPELCSVPVRSTESSTGPGRPKCVQGRIVTRQPARSGAREDRPSRPAWGRAWLSPSPWARG